MKLRLSILLIFLTLLASCSLSDSISENPFIANVYTIPTSESTDQLEFALVADVHLQREESDSGIKRYDDNFEAFLASKEDGYTALLSLGDLVDQQYPVNNAVNTFINRFAKYCSNLFIGTIGNHDIHVANSQQWEDATPDTPGITYYAKRMCVIKCDDVSIYITNNSKRLFGYQQLEYLEQALKKDTSKIKIVFAHENVMTGTELDQSLILYGNPDIYERSNFARIMEENNVSLVLTAHTHRGNAIYKYKEDTFEMNLCAYHAREQIIQLESKGNWYTLSFDTENREIVIKNYQASTKEQIGENRFAY